MTSPAHTQSGSASSQSSQVSITVTFDEIVKGLAAALIAEPTDPEVQSLARLLFDISNNVIPRQEASDFVPDPAKLRGLLSKLADKQIKIASGVISFGENSQFGDVKFGDVAGRDIFKVSILKSNYASDILSEIQAAELQRFVPPKFVKPKNIRNWLSRIHRSKILIIYGNNQFNEAELGRYVALTLATELEAFFQVRPPVLEWMRSAPLRDLNVVLTQRKETAVVLLSQVTPELNGKNFFAHLKQHRHYLVVTTDVPLADWNFPSTDQDKLVDLTDGEVYNVDDLTEKLVLDLQGLNQHLAWHRFLGWSGKSTPTKVAGKLLREVVKDICIPERCESLASFLYHEFEQEDGQSTQKVLSEERFQELVEQVRDDKRRLHYWYFSDLSPREQYMAIALTCFNGLRDYQFFAALDKVVTHAWRRLEPSLYYTDYENLNKLCGQFFQKHDTKSDNPIIESKDANHRSRLFALLWTRHRRRIVSALPVLTKIVKDSVRVQADRRNPDLFGSEQLRDKLRRTIAETLSEVGNIAPMAVADHLLDLATDFNSGCQIVAAQAVARWHFTSVDPEEVVGKTLDDWLEKGLELSISEHLNAQSTAVLTIAKIIDRLTVGQKLPDYLVNRLQHLALLPNVRSRYYFRQPIIPALDRQDLQRVTNLLYDLARYDDMQDSIGTRLITLAQNGGQGEVLTLLEEWQRRKPQTISDADEMHHRVIWLIVEVSAFILCSGAVTFQDRFISLVQTNLQSTNSSQVKFHVLQGIYGGLENDSQNILQQVNRFVQMFLLFTTPRERDTFSRILAVVYTKKLSLLSHPNNFLVNDLIYIWIGNPITPVAQRVGLRAIHYINKKLVVVGDSLSLEHSERTQDMGLVGTIGGSYTHLFRTSIVPLLVTWRQPALRPVVRGLLPEAIVQYQISTTDFDNVIEVMMRADYHESKAIAAALEQAVYYAVEQWLITILLFLVVLLMLMCGIFVVTTP